MIERVVLFIAVALAKWIALERIHRIARPLASRGLPTLARSRPRNVNL